MNQQRRSLLKYSAVFGLMASTGLISVAQAQEWNKACLLYTSPSPRDRTRSRMPSSA